ncbi:hypothetical protein, partial [Segatella maculosa]|uniref:hypothetical protein n=1 Tax=Segatella maculosa TaxID=439703 RepID=UPI0023F49D7A
SVRLIACRDARLVRPLHQPYYLLSILTGRTHEPCVPTCPQSRQLVHKATCLLVKRIGTDARTVRPYMLQSMQLVYKATYLLVKRIGTDARTVRPYIASPIILPAKMIDFSDRPLADRRLSLWFRHAIMGELRDNLSHDRRFYTCPKPVYRVPSRFFQSSFV